jgi:aminoglycoside phosphotransferase (APT) family kinase protein
MRDLRALGQRLTTLHGLTPPSGVSRFDPLASARQYAATIVRRHPEEGGRIDDLLSRGAEALRLSHSAQRPARIVHCDLHDGNVLTADRIYFIDWEYAQLGDPLLDVACVMTYFPRSVAHGALLLEATGLDRAGVTEAMLTELTWVFNLLTYLWYRARRLVRNVPATELHFETMALRRLHSLAPDG